MSKIYNACNSTYHNFAANNQQVKAADILDKYKQHTARWLQELESFPEDAFAKSSPGEWSVAQVADHIHHTTFKCVENAMLCCNGKGERGRSGFGAAVFSFMGAFPPIRLRIKNIPPNTGNIYTPTAVSKETAIANLLAAQEQMEAIIAQIEAADKNIRIAHWAGGWFNALQWFHSAEMHIKHHFRQLARIKKALHR